MGVSGACQGDGDVAVGGDAEVYGLGLGELAGGGGEADAKSFGFAGPAFALGFGDAGVEVVADLFQAALLIRGNPQEWASDAGVLVDAAGGVGATAVAEGDAAALEVAEELVPFGVGRGAVLFAGPELPPAGDERLVAADGFFWVDGFVA